MIAHLLKREHYEGSAILSEEAELMDSHFISKLHDKQRKDEKNRRTQGKNHPERVLAHKHKQY
jgi:hypothetical protein